MLSLQNVTKKFDRFNALENISFEVDRGEFIFIVGTSGAGKTTILRSIIRDVILTSGKIFFENLEVTSLPNNKLPQLRRKIGVVFQDFKILLNRTIFENVAISLEILGKSDFEIKTKVKDALNLVGIPSKMNYFPAQLSAGELQRAAIARAIVSHPPLLLADEPTGNLDPKTGWDILKVLNNINKMGTTIIMATHNVDVVNSINKRVIKLKDGKISKDDKKGIYN